MISAMQWCDLFPNRSKTSRVIGNFVIQTVFLFLTLPFFKAVFTLDSMASTETGELQFTTLTRQQQHYCYESFAAAATELYCVEERKEIRDRPDLNYNETCTRPTPTTYTRAQLLLLDRLFSCPVSDALHERLCDLGLSKEKNDTSRLQRRRKKVRPYRAGRRKQRPLRRQIPVILGVFSTPGVQAAGSLSPTSQDAMSETNVSINTPMQSSVNRSNLVKVDCRPFVQDVSKHFKVLYFNAQSCRNKTLTLCDFIHESNADVVFITETWFKPSGDEVLMRELTPPGFVLYSCPRLLQGGGGIAVLYRESLKKCMVITVSKEFKSFELCRVRLTYANWTQTFLCLYRPPPSARNGLKDSQFIEEFPQLLVSLSSASSEAVLLGDFNFHYDCPTNSNVKKLKTFLEIHAMSQLITKPTQKKGHTLEWLIVGESKLDAILELFVSDELISDHYPVTFSLNLKKPGLNKRIVTSRNLRAVDMAALKADVTALQFGSDDPVTDYNQGLQEVMDKHAPLTTRHVTDRPSAPWLTLEVKHAKKERRCNERQWRKSRLTVHRQIFVYQREKVKRLIHDASAQYTSTKIQECSSSRGLFQVVGQLTGKAKDKTLPNCMPEKELPDAFSEFFVNKIEQIRHELDQSGDTPEFSVFAGTSMCDFKPVTEAEMKEILVSAPRKSCGLDPIPACVLYECLDELTPVITNVVNRSLSSGVVHASFKHAIVTPLLKKSNLDPNVLKHYRPVSNLPFLSKALERAVLRQLLDHLTRWDMLEPFQSAYRAFHSTETALLRVVNDLLWACDRGEVSVLSLLDLSAAFDTIDHQILLHRLQTSFGLSGTVLKWFASYLQERTQTVVVQGHKSKVTTLNYGVPQGSVLGPVLFTVYVQSLSQVIRQFDVQYHMFADDTQLQQSARPAQFSQMLETAQETIESVKGWMTVNKLKMNDEKTEIMPVGTGHKLKMVSDITSLSLNGTRIEFSQTARNLGVHLDSSLTMETHVNKLCRSIYLELRRIAHIRRFLSLEAAKKIMSAFVLSRLDYCNSLFAGLPDCLLERLQKAQNHAARIILRKRKFDHAKPLLRQLHWLPVCARVEYKLATVCYRSLHGLSPAYISDLLTLYLPSRSLRSSNAGHLTIPRFNLKKYGGRSFAFVCPSTYNALPQALKKAPTLSAFKAGLKTHLFKLHLPNE
eukprot:TRINITY_DN3715_c0_g1_i1.p1 TRINITY_DN3715_c0_g1~~TRINITY_DN3715_c0_g1_i1.p1  ORF type:complete len:1177 (-),score=226.07 TRINITY_DN3715_c0_g1_i1:25-3555(-)